MLEVAGDLHSAPAKFENPSSSAFYLKMEVSEFTHSFHFLSPS